MVLPRPLPSVRTVEEDFKEVVGWVNCFLYAGIILYTGVSLISIVMNGPQMAEEQLPDWGSMPQLTLCLDNGTSTFVQSKGFVELGFGHKSAESALSGDCAETDSPGYTEASRWIEGAAVEGTAGRCHRLDLTRLSPFAEGTIENNLMIGGIADYSGGLFPKFIAVSTSDAQSQGLSSVLANPLLYLYPQRFLLDELGRPRRIQAPSYALDKQKVPQEPLPWVFSSSQRELYAVRNMGLWKSCVPMRLQKGMKAGQVVFGFGLFITSPTIKSVYSVGLVWQVLKLIGSIGGWCGISMIIWRCIFVRPEGASWPSDQEQRTLHPHLKGWHQFVKSSMEGMCSRAAARELEEPFVQ
mmetsp:Transcript_112108/g.327956  ORF Transcript_112108/g.327956 Transcript_112108/m.327956 type:complete len:354 (-) Transcript_112108:63-1124(-)